MSYQNFDSFSGQPGQPEQSAPGQNPPPQSSDGQMTGQGMDGVQTGFQGGAGEASAAGQAPGDMKTTLW